MDNPRMSKFRSSVLAVAAMLATAVPALATAASFEAWNGSAWVNNASVSYQGPVTFKWLDWSIPCTANLNVSIVAGNASVTSATFTGSPACTGVVGHSLPWPMIGGAESLGPNPPFAGAPPLTTPLRLMTINIVRFYLPPPLDINCPSSTTTASIGAFIDAGGNIVLKSAVGPCSLETRNNGKLVPSAPVRVVS